jgi:membrane protein DedA with SNARE-associated domain
MEELIIQLMEQYGYFGMFFMIFVENLFPPIPSEVILTFGGFMTTYTSLTIPYVILSATIGAVAGAIVLYYIGTIFNVEKLEAFTAKYGKILHLKVEDVARANAWFEKRGALAVFLCRMVPVLRSLISIPAGMSRMKMGTFMTYTIIGTLLWNILLVSAGALLGASWHTALEYMDVYQTIAYVAMGAVGLGVIYWLFKKNKA